MKHSKGYVLEAQQDGELSR
ncbi:MULTISPECIES: hypothetical protein [Escherichia]